MHVKYKTSIIQGDDNQVRGWLRLMEMGDGGALSKQNRWCAIIVTFKMIVDQKRYVDACKRKAYND